MPPVRRCGRHRHYQALCGKWVNLDILRPPDRAGPRCRHPVPPAPRQLGASLHLQTKRSGRRLSSPKRDGDLSRPYRLPFEQTLDRADPRMRATQPAPLHPEAVRTGHQSPVRAAQPELHLKRPGPARQPAGRHNFDSIRPVSGAPRRFRTPDAQDGRHSEDHSAHQQDDPGHSPTTHGGRTPAIDSNLISHLCSQDGCGRSRVIFARSAATRQPACGSSHG